MTTKEVIDQPNIPMRNIQCWIKNSLDLAKENKEELDSRMPTQVAGRKSSPGMVATLTTRHTLNN